MSTEKDSIHQGAAAASGAPSHRELPDEKTIAEAGEVMIKDKDGQDIPLKSLWSGKGEGEKQLIIFVRHFFCGSCKQYIQALKEDLPVSDLASARTQITIVGCGGPVCIPLYAADTACPWPIYADPTQRTHALLGMGSNPRESATRPAYIHTGFWENALRSTWKALASGRAALSSGPPGQNGGEWLFVGDGEGGARLAWCHRMRNTSDHTEVAELRGVLGIEGDEK